jgi:redox-sensitive bicupin YhaK (pirin superfamily)
VTPEGSAETAKNHQDMTLYLSRLDKGMELAFHQAEGRRIFLFVIDGRLTANDTPLDKRDSARIKALSDLTIRAEEEAFLMLIDLP